MQPNADIRKYVMINTLLAYSFILYSFVDHCMSRKAMAEAGMVFKSLISQISQILKEL